MQTKSFRFILFLIVFFFCNYLIQGNGFGKVMKSLVVELNIGIFGPTVDADVHLLNGFALHTRGEVPVFFSNDDTFYVTGNFGLRYFSGDKNLDGLFVGFIYIIGKYPNLGNIRGGAFEGGWRYIFSNGLTLSFNLLVGILDTDVRFSVKNLTIYGNLLVGIGFAI